MSDETRIVLRRAGMRTLVSKEHAEADTYNQLEAERRIFRALLAMGIDEETANAMMIAKHNHEAGTQ